MAIIFTSDTINISTDYKTVFEYISNLENDRFWRKEINSTTMSSKPQTGVMATENSFLSKRVPNNVLILKCIELLENKHIVYQTLSDSKFYLKSVRKVESISENESKVTYTIEFDNSIVKHGLGIGLPKFIIDMVTKSDMKKYLKKLKAVLESQV